MDNRPDLSSAIKLMQAGNLITIIGAGLFLFGCLAAACVMVFIFAG